MRRSTSWDRLLVEMAQRFVVVVVVFFAEIFTHTHTHTHTQDSKNFLIRS